MQWVSVLTEWSYAISFMPILNNNIKVQFIKWHLWTPYVRIWQKGHSLYSILNITQQKWNEEHTWRQSKAGSIVFKFLVSNASRSGFRTSSACAPSRVCPALDKTVVMVPLLPTGLPTWSASSILRLTEYELAGSVAVLAAPPSVSRELQTRNNFSIRIHLWIYWWKSWLNSIWWHWYILLNLKKRFSNHNLRKNVLSVLWSSDYQKKTERISVESKEAFLQ